MITPVESSTEKYTGCRLNLHIVLNYCQSTQCKDDTAVLDRKLPRLNSTARVKWNLRPRVRDQDELSNWKTLSVGWLRQILPKTLNEYYNSSYLYTSGTCRWSLSVSIAQRPHPAMGLMILDSSAERHYQSRQGDKFSPVFSSIKKWGAAEFPITPYSPVDARLKLSAEVISLAMPLLTFAIWQVFFHIFF